EKHSRYEGELRAVRLVVAARETAALQRELEQSGDDLDKQIEGKQLHLSEIDSQLVRAELARHDALTSSEKHREQAWALARGMERLEAISTLASERKRALDAELAATTEAAARAKLTEVRRQLQEIRRLSAEAANREKTDGALAERARLAAREAAEALAKIRSAEEEAAAVHRTDVEAAARLEAEAAGSRRLEPVKEAVVAAQKEITTLQEEVRAIVKRAWGRSKEGLAVDARISAIKDEMGNAASLLSAVIGDSGQAGSHLESLRKRIEESVGQMKGLRDKALEAAESHRAASAAHERARVTAGAASARKRLLEEREEALTEDEAGAAKSIQQLGGRRKALAEAAAGAG
ncbi:MAG: hypothetical protein ACRDIA_09170, partial [Actinomycetota bacterium]